MWNEEYLPLANAEKERFAKIVNYILNKTYILREIYEPRDRVGKINGDYRFFERYLSIFTEYLEIAGYEIDKDDADGIISLNNRFEYNVSRLDKFTTLMLLVLRETYDDGREKNTTKNVVYISISDLVLKMIDRKLIVKKPAIKDVVDALRTLIKHNIITKYEGDIDNSGCIILIYPTITKLVSNEKITAIYEAVFKEAGVTSNEDTNDQLKNDLGI